MGSDEKGERMWRGEEIIEKEMMKRPHYLYNLHPLPPSFSPPPPFSSIITTPPLILPPFSYFHNFPSPPHDFLTLIHSGGTCQFEVQLMDNGLYTTYD